MQCLFSAASGQNITLTCISCLEYLQRKQHHGTAEKLQKPILPPDFVEKQRAYFAEIDAFELPEEEVSDGGLE